MKNNRAKSMSCQNLAMQFYPQFSYIPGGGLGGGMWFGTLTPRETTYRVQITYYDHLPRVYVTSPEIHLHYDTARHPGSLGLYYPPDGSWTPKKLIANTIVPWACLWLYFYEIWITTGTWYGEGEQHRAYMEAKASE